MRDLVLTYLIPFGAAAVAAIAVFLYWVASRRRIAAETIGRAEEQAQRTLRDTDREVETRKKEASLEAKEKAHNLLMETERLVQDRRGQLSKLEQAVGKKEEKAAERLNAADQHERDLKAREQTIRERERATTAAAAKYESLVAEQQIELQRVAGLSAEEAKELLLKQIEADARRDSANLIKRLEAQAREEGASRAKQIITEAIQRSAPEHAIETTVSVVDLPSDDLKGRIIGREGRNIILSGFDPYRREIAKQAIERLIADGRIHPARIEEVVEKVKADLEESVRKDGEAAAFELGLHDLHPDILLLIGRLKFRTSYGQNVLHHSKEVAYLSGMMARQLDLDFATTVRAAFLHDIGKAIDREMQGTHLEIGVDFLRRHGESEPVIAAIASHHMDIDWPSLEAMIVQAADAISAARPGARRDILESYVKRLEKLEGIADSFKGVSKAFALQAGREVRIMVESEKISDEEAVWLSKDIARRIENELEYPGQIKVTVIRETRAVEYAK